MNSSWCQIKHTFLSQSRRVITKFGSGEQVFGFWPVLQLVECKVHISIDSKQSVEALLLAPGRLVSDSIRALFYGHVGLQFTRWSPPQLLRHISHHTNPHKCGTASNDRINVTTAARRAFFDIACELIAIGPGIGRFFPINTKTIVIGVEPYPECWQEKMRWAGNDASDA